MDYFVFFYIFIKPHLTYDITCDIITFVSKVSPKKRKNQAREHLDFEQKNKKNLFYNDLYVVIIPQPFPGWQVFLKKTTANYRSSIWQSK